MGVSRAALLSGAQAAPPFAVWPDNWDAVCLFETMATQWDYDPAGRQCRLVYEAADLPMRHLGLRGRRARAAFAGMQIIEAAWLKRVRAGDSAA